MEIVIIVNLIVYTILTKSASIVVLIQLNRLRGVAIGS